jgi:TP901-1 family phage major tail protein
MAGEFTGRSFTLKKGSTSGTGGTAIAGCRTKSFTVNNSSIDITNDDSTGVRELLDVPGEKTVEISFSGIAKDVVALTAAMSSTDVVDEYLMEWPTSHKLYGDFFIASYAQTGEYQGAATFECTLQSAGAVTVA